MSCSPYRDLILLSLDGAVEPADLDRLWTHLGQCAACRRYLGQARETVAWLEAEELPAVPAGLGGRLRVLAARAGRRARLLRWARSWPAAAAAAVLLALGLALLRPWRTRERPSPAAHLDFAGREVERDLSAIALAIERHSRSLDLASLAAGPEPTTRALTSEPPEASLAPARFDEELLRIGGEIEALDRPIFGEWGASAPASEEGGNG